MTRQRLIGEIYLGEAERPDPTGEKEEIQDQVGFIARDGDDTLKQRHDHKADVHEHDAEGVSLLSHARQADCEIDEENIRDNAAGEECV